MVMSGRFLKKQICLSTTISNRPHVLGVTNRQNTALSIARDIQSSVCAYCNTRERSHWSGKSTDGSQEFWNDAWRRADRQVGCDCATSLGCKVVFDQLL